MQILYHRYKKAKSVLPLIQLYQTQVFYHEKRGWNIHLARLYCLLATPLTNIFYRGLNLISTYKDSRFIKTLKESYQAIKDGYNIILFPEMSDEGYFDQLKGFHQGFVLLLDYCHKKGIDLPVVVTYYHKKSNVHMIDNPIMYSEIIKNCKTFFKKILKNYQCYPIYYKTYHPCYPQSAYNRDSCPFPRLALLFYGSSCCDTWKVEQ